MIFYIQKKSNLDREVTVNFTTIDGSATGRSIMYLLVDVLVEGLLVGA